MSDKLLLFLHVHPYHYKALFHHNSDIETKKQKVTKVFQKNVGIVLGKTSGGGLDYKDWLDGKPFPKYEDREYTCPAWWFQNTDYKRKPNWDECYANLGGTFSGCPHFKNKDNCWKKFDREGK